MTLKLQSQHGSITENGIRAVRQAVMTGELVERADVLACLNEVFRMKRELADVRRDVERMQGVLGTAERDALAANADAWNEGWMAGTEAMVRDRGPEERILALLDVVGAEAANPYTAQMDAPIVEDLPGPIGIVPEVTC